MIPTCTILMLSAAPMMRIFLFIPAGLGNLFAWKGDPFFFMYQTVFKCIGVCLPFTPFERELLTEINTAPTQLHPNSWAFVRAFQILCGYLGILPSVDVFLHFFPLCYLPHVSFICALVGLHNCFGPNFCRLVCLNVGSVMDASKRMVLGKAMKAARAAKADASSAPAADPNPSLTLPLPPPTTAEAPLGSSSPPSHSPQPLQTPNSPPPIAAVPLAVASSPAPTPLDKGKRVLEILSDDEDSDGGVVFKRRKAARVPILPAASP